MAYWLNRTFEGAAVSVEEALRDFLREVQGFLYLGTTPVGNTVRNFVWITEKPADGLTFKLPGPVISLPELRTGTDGEATVYKEGQDYEIHGDEVVFFSPPEDLIVLGDHVLFYVPHVTLEADNLWATYGSKLTDLYRKDSELYRSVLEAILGLFTLGPTKWGVETLFELPTGADVEVCDYVLCPKWWHGKVLPDWMVGGISDLPIIGDDLVVGDFIVVPNDYLLYLHRNVCFNSGLIYYGDGTSRYGGREFNNRPIYYGGASTACIYMENIGKYHLFAVRGTLETFSILTRDLELFKAFHEGLLEGKLISSYPLIYGEHVEVEVVRLDLADAENYYVELTIWQEDYHPGQLTYGTPNLLYNTRENWFNTVFPYNWFSTAARIFSHFFGDSELQFGGGISYGTYMGTVVTQDYTRFVRVRYYGEDGIVFGGERVAYGVFVPMEYQIFFPIKYGQNENMLGIDAISVKPGLFLKEYFEVNPYEYAKAYPVIPKEDLFALPSDIMRSITLQLVVEEKQASSDGISLLLSPSPVIDVIAGIVDIVTTNRTSYIEEFFSFPEDSLSLTLVIPVENTVGSATDSTEVRIEVSGVSVTDSLDGPSDSVVVTTQFFGNLSYDAEAQYLDGVILRINQFD